MLRSSGQSKHHERAVDGVGVLGGIGDGVADAVEQEVDLGLIDRDVVHGHGLVDAGLLNVADENLAGLNVLDRITRGGISLLELRDQRLDQLFLGHRGFLFGEEGHRGAKAVAVVVAGIERRDRRGAQRVLEVGGVDDGGQVDRVELLHLLHVEQRPALSRGEAEARSLVDINVILNGAEVGSDFFVDGRGGLLSGLGGLLRGGFGGGLGGRFGRGFGGRGGLLAAGGEAQNQRERHQDR